MKKRSIAAVIVFSFLTGGIYTIWWAYVTLTALQAEGKKNSIPPLLTGFLCLPFIGMIGGALLGFDADRNLTEIRKSRGLLVYDNKYLWIVVGLLAFPVVAGLIQRDINQWI